MTTVERYNLVGPGQLVLDSLTLGLTCGPKLQILRSIIRAIPIDVMHLFVGKELSPKMRRHDFSMLPNPLTAPASSIGSVYVSPVVNQPLGHHGSGARTLQRSATPLALVVHHAEALRNAIPLTIRNFASIHFPSVSQKGEW